MEENIYEIVEGNNCDDEHLKKQNHIVVKSIHLAYEIIRAGYLHFLFGLRKDKYNSNKYIWFFSNCLPVREIVEQHMQRSRKYKLDLQNSNELEDQVNK